MTRPWSSYRLTNTETGHKDPALNTTDHYDCVDMFVKRKGPWLVIYSVCWGASEIRG